MIRTAIACIGLCALPAYSAIELGSNFSLSGFGSTSWAQSDNDTELFTNRRVLDEACFDCDTTFGVQLDYFYDAFQASVQVVKRPQDDWSGPELEWAYISYDIGDFEFRAGRLRLPLFLMSEYFYVGQAYDFARPPVEVYNAVLGITAYNGASFSWNYEVNDDITLVFSPMVGLKDENEVDFNNSTKLEFETNSMWGFNLTLHGDSYRWNLAYLDSSYDQTTILYNTVPGFPEFATELEDEEIALWSLGAEYEFGPLTTMAEFQTNDLGSSWYASASYNLERITPYVVYGMRLDPDEDRVGDSYLVGLRYDLLTNVSLNAEWQYLEAYRDNRGPFIVAPASDTDANLYTLMVSFVF